MVVCNLRSVYPIWNPTKNVVIRKKGIVFNENKLRSILTVLRMPLA